MTLLPVSVLSAAATALLSLAFAGAAVAAPPGGVIVKPVDPLPAGEWRARIRYLSPHHGQDGRYMTWKYVDITASSQTYCESQLQNWYGTGGNVQVVDFCTFHSYFG